MCLDLQGGRAGEADHIFHRAVRCTGLFRAIYSKGQSAAPALVVRL